MVGLRKLTGILPLVVMCGLIICDRLLLSRSGIENPWIAMTGPWCNGHWVNSIAGYAWFFGNHGLIHNENFSIFADQAMFAGQLQNASFYAVRPGLSLLAYALFLLPVWQATSMAILGMALLAAIAMYFIGRRYGLPPVLCALIGTSTYLLGSISFHLADYSSHIAGPATWILASLVVLVLRPWERDADWRAFFLAHLTFWIVTPFYWSNIVCYFALVLMFLGRPGRLAVSLVLFAGCYFWRDGWAFAMNYAYGGNFAYSATEAEYLTRALDAWRGYFTTGGITEVARRVQLYALQAITPEPLVVVGTLIIIGVAIARARALRNLVSDKFLIFALLSGLGACSLVVIWGPAAGARGYLAYGVPIALMIAMIAAVGSAEFGPAGMRVISAALVILICFQIVWVKSLTIGNPMPVCQYFLAERTFGAVFLAFAESLLQRPTFLRFGSELHPHGLSSANKIISEALAQLSSTLSPHRTGQIDSSRRLMPSLILGAFLILPLALLLVVALRRPIAAGPFRIRGGVLGATALLVWWLAAWAAVPVTRSGGVAYYDLRGTCAAEGLAKRYRLTIPAGFANVLSNQQIDQVELVGGFHRFRSNEVISIEIGRVGNDNSPIVRSPTPRLPAEQFKQLLSPNGDSTELTLTETYSAPPLQYVGSHKGSIVAGCVPSDLTPTMELRGYSRERVVLLVH